MTSPEPNRVARGCLAAVAWTLILIAVVGMLYAGIDWIARVISP